MSVKAKKVTREHLEALAAQSAALRDHIYNLGLSNAYGRNERDRIDFDIAWRTAHAKKEKIDKEYEMALEQYINQEAV